MPRQDSRREFTELNMWEIPCQTAVSCTILPYIVLRNMLLKGSIRTL